MEETSPKDDIPSHNVLHSVKPSENIAESRVNYRESEEIVEKVHESHSFEKSISGTENESKEDKKPPETSKSLDLNISKDEPKSISPKASVKLAASSRPTDLDKQQKTTSLIEATTRVPKNQSDIFALKDEPNIASAIFSVNGAPSRKLYRKKEMPLNNVFPIYDPPSDKAQPESKARPMRTSCNELRRPSSSLRNPLTGIGLTSNDEYKFKPNKRKDGNPLLGVGYTPEVTHSSHRIPPGGVSHKLW